MTILEDLKSGRLVVVPPVSVKPLVWEKDGSVGGHGGWLGSAGGETRAVKIGWIVDEPFEFGAQTFRALDEAKAAAQADYEARVLSALTASPDHTAGLIALVEGMEREREDLRLGIISLIWLPGVRAALDKLPPGDGLQKHMARLEELVAAEAEVDAQDRIIIAAKRERDAAEAKADALREALAKVRGRFFPQDQGERERDELWDEVNRALTQETNDAGK